MECNRCESGDGVRMEVRFQSEAKIITYLCQSCAHSMADDPEILEVNPSFRR